MKITKKFFYGCAIVIAVGVLFKIWLLGALVRFAIRDQTALRKRNEVRGIYLKIPFPLSFKVYLFNVTNAQDIQNGAKPIVKEVGPYWYDEFKEKVDVVDNDTEDSLTYTPYDIFQFNQNKSGALSQDDYVTIIHPVIVGMVSLVLRDSPVFLSIVNQALPSLFNGAQSIFLTAKVRDILFDGVELNCTSNDFAPKSICSQMKNQIPGLKIRKDNEKVFLFSLLGPRNGTSSKRLKVLRGIFHSKDLGRLIEVDGEKKINIWSTEQCNRFNGTDGWIFPPMLEPEDGLKTFSTDLCRNIKMKYANDSLYNKVPVRLYSTDLGDQTNDENEKCYCRSPDSCLAKGLFDLTKCMGVPLFATLPHFLHTDEKYLNQVDGLEPDELKHSLMVYFEPMTGTPMFAAKRMQFNFDLQPTPKVTLFAKVPNVLFPLFWIEESVVLDGYLLKKIQTIFLLLSATEILLYLIIICGSVCLGAITYLHLKNRKTVEITPAATVKSTKEPSRNPASNHVMSGHEFDRY